MRVAVLAVGLLFLMSGGLVQAQSARVGEWTIGISRTGGEEVHIARVQSTNSFEIDGVTVKATLSIECKSGPSPEARIGLYLNKPGAPPDRVGSEIEVEVQRDRDPPFKTRIFTYGPTSLVAAYRTLPDLPGRLVYGRRAAFTYGGRRVEFDIAGMSDIFIYLKCPLARPVPALNPSQIVDIKAWMYQWGGTDLNGFPVTEAHLFADNTHRESGSEDKRSTLKLYCTNDGRAVMVWRLPPDMKLPAETTATATIDRGAARPLRAWRNNINTAFVTYADEIFGGLSLATSTSLTLKAGAVTDQFNTAGAAEVLDRMSRACGLRA